MPHASLTIELKEPVREFSLVTTEGRRANSNDTSHAGRIFGVTGGGHAATGQVREVHAWGKLSNQKWTWMTNDIIYLNGYALSTVPPETGFLLRVGSAINEHVMMVDLGEPVIL